MIQLNLKQKVIIAAMIVATVLIFLFLKALPGKSDSTSPTSTSTSTSTSTPAPVSPTDKPQIVSTKPDPLDESMISATEVIEITFNRPLENVGEFKVKIEPEIAFKVELSGDRKTGKIIPAKPYQLSTTYTLFIGTETKFDGVGRWGEEKIFHFKTIKYTGV